MDVGQAISGPLEAGQRLYWGEQKAPVEIDNMKALTRMHQATAQKGEAELAQEKLFSDLAKGMPPEKNESASQYLLRFGKSVTAAGMPLQGMQAIQHSALAGQQEERARSMQSLEGLRKAQTAEHDFKVFADVFRQLQHPSQIPAAMKLFRQFGGSEESSREIEEALNQMGLRAIPYLHKAGMTAAEEAQAEWRRAEEQRRRDKDQSDRELKRAGQELQRTKANAYLRSLELQKKTSGQLPIASKNEREQAESIISGRHSDFWESLADSKQKDATIASLASAAKQKLIQTKSAMTYGEALESAYQDLQKAGEYEPVPGLANEVRKAAGRPEKVRLKQDKSPKPGAPTLEEFLSKARPLNKGVSDEDLKAHWEKMYAQ